MNPLGALKRRRTTAVAPAAVTEPAPAPEPAPKTSGSGNPRYYRSHLRTGLRFLAQDVVMKAGVWSMCKVHVHGDQLLDTVEPPFIVVGNHSGHLDAALICGALPYRLSKHLATGAAADYFFDKKVKGAMTSLFFNAYPVERQGLRTRQGLSRHLLEAGIPLLIFPEGTRTRTGALGGFSPGVAALSISLDLPVIPVALVGSYEAWPRTRALPPTNHPDVHVVFSDPLTPYPGEIAREFADRMQRTIATLHDSTARAYGFPTFDDYARAAAWKKAQPAAPEPSPPPSPPPSSSPQPPASPEKTSGNAASLAHLPFRGTTRRHRRGAQGEV